MFSARVVCQPKRNTINALAFEKHFEANIFALYDEIIKNNYKPKSSIRYYAYLIGGISKFVLKEKPAKTK